MWCSEGRDYEAAPHMDNSELMNLNIAAGRGELPHATFNVYATHCVI